MKKILAITLALLFEATTSFCATSPATIPNDKLQIGQSTAGNKEIILNKGSGSSNPRFRWNNSTSKLQFSNDGSAFNDFSAGATALWGQVVGSSAQVSAGAATVSSFASAISAASAGDVILVLAGTYTENVSVSKKLYFIGQGHGTVVNGTWTWASGSSYSGLSGVKLTDNMTFNSGVDGIQVWSIWFASGKTFIDNTTTTNNYYQGFQE